MTTVLELMKSEYVRLRRRRLVLLFCTQKGEDMSSSSSIWFWFDAKWLMFFVFMIKKCLF
jgi:hypothetical protein